MTETDSAEEILDRISREHLDGKHLVGPMAGCSFCLKASQEQTAELEAARAQLGGGGAAAALERLAMAQAQPSRPRGELLEQIEQDVADDREPGVRAVTELGPRRGRAAVPIHRAKPLLDGATLRDLADTSVHAAMSCLDDPHAQAKQEGIVHALVAVANAVLAVEETIRVTRPGQSGAPGAA